MPRGKVPWSWNGMKRRGWWLVGCFLKAFEFMWEDFKLGIFQQQFLDNLDKLDTQIYGSNLIVLLFHVLSICSERDVLCLLATMDFRCWWSCFPRRRSLCWMHGSTWIINLKKVVFQPSQTAVSIDFEGRYFNPWTIMNCRYQVKSCEANISQIWTAMQSRPFPSSPGDLFRSVALRGGEGTNHHCWGGLSSVSSRWKRPDLCFLLQSHRDMMCFQSPDWGFKWSIHFLRGLSAFLKSHELFQVVSVGAGTILANGVELNILPLGPGVITYLPPWKLVWAFQGDELEPPVKVAWLTCCERIPYHNWVEDLANPSECWQSDLSSPSTCTFCRRMLYLCIFLLVVPFVPLLQQFGRLVTKFAFAMEMRWATKIAVESETHRLFLLPLPQDSKQNREVDDK